MFSDVAVYNRKGSDDAGKLTLCCRIKAIREAW